MCPRTLSQILQSGAFFWYNPFGEKNERAIEKGVVVSKMYLVRHGQASFGELNYDRLSELGGRQCRLLGEYWARQGVALDAVYLGTLARQRASLDRVREAYAAAGLPFPEPIVMPEWNEYNMQALLTGTVPQTIAQDPQVAALLRELAPDGKPDFVHNKKALNRLLGVVMDLWVDGKLGATGMGTWSEFTRRVHRGLDRIMSDHPSGRSVAVFTSGGPVSAALQRALAVPDKPAMQVGWVIVNSSVSEFRFDAHRFSLVSFNTFPHLEGNGLMTVR